MITVKIDDEQVRKLLASMPKIASRAAEIALDKTARAIRDEIKDEMKRVFDRPVPYTLNSLQITPTKNHNMEASVWFKDPERMRDHYLLPEVEGGKRKLKGFERAIGSDEFVPGRGARKDRFGNVSAGQIRQILSVLGKAEAHAGSMQNLTARSAKRNTKDRDYVYLPKGTGNLPPGVYQRIQTGAGFGAKTKRKIGKFGAWQKGNRKVAVRDKSGRIIRWETPRSKIQTIVRAKGLLPILVRGRTGHAVKPVLKFYDIAARVYDEKFRELFYDKFNELANK